MLFKQMIKLTNSENVEIILFLNCGRDLNKFTVRSQFYYIINIYF